jgi:hypothetical protein
MKHLKMLYKRINGKETCQVLGDKVSKTHALELAELEDRIHFHKDEMHKAARVYLIQRHKQLN